jgi:hypothetical protein
MSTGAIIRLVLQALVFAAWAFMMYRTLFTFRSRDADQNGGPFPSTGGFIAQAKYWLKSDEDKSDRKTLFFLTFVLIAMNLTNVLTSA